MTTIISNTENAALSTISAKLSLEALLACLPELTPNDQALIERAYQRARVAHEGQTRKSGEPYFTHCASVAMILADMKLDAEAIAAGLMHDIIEDTPVTEEELRAEFGDTITHMVVSVTKLEKLPISSSESKHNGHLRSSRVNREKEYMRKMLLTIGDDVRVVLIKLADRLHNMRTLGYMKADKQRRIAWETREIFAPLANRLGIWQIKWELEDLCMRYLEPDDYKAIARSLDERRDDREKYVMHFAQRLREGLAEYQLDHATITARPKHLYSIYKKMQRKDVDFEHIYDVRAVRVIVNTIPECYQVLGVVHNLWRPIPSEFDDYIGAPKDNFYQSLHTAIYDENGKVVEVQIRTWDMHEHAEYGVAAHWRYKEGSGRHDENFVKRLNYLRRLMEFGPEVMDDAEDFMEAMKANFFQDRVYVFTPRGDIVDLPAGATPIDFAYHIHTDVGHRCRGAKVNGQLVGLDYTLRSGEQVDILTSNRGGPSMDWLNDDLGYIRTQRAKSKIRQWFRKLNRDRHIALGRETVEREMKKMGVYNTMAIESVAQLFSYSDLNDFLSVVGAGDINGAQIAHRVLDEERKRKEAQDEGGLLKVRHRAPLVVDRDNGVKIMGTGGLMTNMATCCNPAPGDPIVGYITRGRGVTIHRRDCRNVATLREKEPQRLTDVSWGSPSDEQRYAVPVEIVAYDRPGLIRDVSTVIADQKVNMLSVNVHTRQDIATLNLTLEINSNQQLTRILARIESIPSVTEAFRCNST